MGTNESEREHLTALRARVAKLEAENTRLCEDAERHRGLFEAMNEGFVLHEVALDERGRVIDLRYLEMNDAFAALWRLTPADMIGQTIHHLLPAVSRWWIETLLQVALTGAPTRFERLGQVTGRYYEVQAWSPRPGQCAVLFHDVTERRQADEALRESERRFRELADATPHLVWTARPDGTVDYYNQRYLEFTGIHREGEDWQWGPVLHPDDAEPTVRAWEHAVAMGTVYEIEHRVRRADGSYRWYLSRGVPARDAEGRITKWYGTATDIHATKEAQQALRDSEERFRNVLDNSRDVIYRSDVRKGVYDYLSPSVKNLTGFTEQELDAMPVTWSRDRIHPEDRERYVSGIDALSRRPPGERSEIVEYRWLHKSGEYRWISNSRSLLSDAKGRPVALVGTLRDITTRRAMEQRLRELNETLEARVSERTRQLRALAAELTVAEEHERRRLARFLHDDLQQTLAAVAFHLDRIRGCAPNADEELQEPIDMLREAIRTSRSLTAELSPTILYDTGLEEALGWLGRRIEEQHGIRVTVDIARPADAPMIAEDVRVLLYQSVRELLFNVAKHARAREANVSLRRPTIETVEVVVSDAGEGFDARRRPGGQPGAGGFGLFSISERLRYIGGDVRIESAPGHGTRVTLVAPLQPLSARETGGTDGEKVVDAAAEGGERRDGRIRILLADDHAIVRKGLLRLLQEQADLVVVGEAGDGHEAVEMARALRPDVVLMDLAMPTMDGIEATRRIAAELPEIRVVGLSMYDDHEKEDRMRQAGARAYIAKGGPPTTLLAAIRGEV